MRGDESKRGSSNWTTHGKNKGEGEGEDRTGGCWGGRGRRLSRGLSRRRTMQKKLLSIKVKIDGCSPNQIDVEIDCRIQACMLDNLLFSLLKCWSCPVENPEILVYVHVEIYTSMFQLGWTIWSTLSNAFNIQLGIIYEIIDRLHTEYNKP